MKSKKGLILDLDFETIFKVSPSIRFVGVCNVHGKLLDAEYRSGVTPLLSETDLQFSVIKTSIRNTTRIDNEGDMGSHTYSVSTYENVKRTTIPLHQNLLLLKSFERREDEGSIIEKILELINSTKKGADLNSDSPN